MKSRYPKPEPYDTRDFAPGYVPAVGDEVTFTQVKLPDIAMQPPLGTRHYVLRPTLRVHLPLTPTSALIVDPE